MFPAPGFQQDWAPGSIPQHPVSLFPLGALCHQAESPCFIPHPSGCPGLPDTEASQRKLQGEDCLTA